MSMAEIVRRGKADHKKLGVGIPQRAWSPSGARRSWPRGHL